MAVNSEALVKAGVVPSPERTPGEAAAAFADRLGRAIERNELWLAYQPQAETDTGRICGFEALVRWRLPDGTMVPPDLFIPIAEDTDAILTLGEWVLRRACATAARWLGEGVSDVPVAVNLSARQLAQPDLARLVLGVLADTGLPAASLKLELTETALLHTAPSVDETLVELRGAGVRVVLDDFGTGYSSLALLHRVPLETVKIDRQFVAAMVEDRNAAAIVHAVIALGHALGLSVVAEGVETREQLLFLRAYRCDRVQGYLIARPMDEAQVPAFMARGGWPTGG